MTVWQSALNPHLTNHLHEIHRSTDYDWILWPYEIKATTARVAMLYACQLLSLDEKVALEEALADLSDEISSGLRPALQDEDVHGWIERCLVEKVGPLGAKPHLGRSRNEQVLVDTKLYLRDHAGHFRSCLMKMIDQLGQLAVTHNQLLIPSYTHLQRAQPMFLGQYFKAHQVVWGRHLRNLHHFIDELNKECPMGSGAINGSTLDTDPSIEAQLLGFEQACTSPLAHVSFRTDLIEFGGLVAHWVTDVSRMMEDLVLWSSSEFGFLRWRPGLTTGSSMMPQKRNPDLCELLRGKASAVQGLLQGLLGLTKGLPMGYMKDLQEDKPLLFGICNHLKAYLGILPELLQGMDFQSKVMKQAVSDPFLLATDVMEYIISEQGFSMRDAHHTIANLVEESAGDGLLFQKLIRENWPEIPKHCFDAFLSCQIRAGQKEKV